MTDPAATQQKKEVREEGQKQVDRAQEAADQAKDAADEIKAKPDAEPVEVATRVAFALVAGGTTYFLSRFFLELDETAAKEVSILNAGVAYYTHEAAGRVVAGLNKVYRSASRRWAPTNRNN